MRCPASVWGVVPLELFKWLTKILGNPFPFVSQYMDSSCQFWAGLELNQGGEAVGCTSWWAVFCSHPPDPRSGMSATTILGTWVEANAYFLFTDNNCLCVFKKHSQLYYALQLGIAIAAHSKIGLAFFGQVWMLLWFTLSPPMSIIHPKRILVNGESNTVNEGRKG